MSMSGVSVGDDVVKAYEDMKTGKSYKYIIMDIPPPASADSKKRSISVIRKVEKPKEGDECDYFDLFKSELPRDSCRYALYDMEYVTVNGSFNQKIVLILWTPDSSSIKDKMLYASSKSALKSKLIGVGLEKELHDADDLNKELLQIELQKH